MARRPAAATGAAAALAMRAGPAAAAPAAPWPAEALAASGALAALALLACGVLAVLLWRRRRRLDLYADAFAAVPQPRQVVGADGRVLCTNPAYQATFPGPPRPLPEALAEAVGEDEEMREQLRRLAANAANGVPGHAELRVRRLPGAEAADAADAADVTWLFVAALPMAGGRGRVLWRADDITPRRQMQEVIEAEQARFVDLLEHAPVGFYSVDGTGRFLFVNQTLAEWLGVTPEALVDGGHRLHELLERPPGPGAPAHSPFPAEAGAPAAGGEEERGSAHGEVAFARPDGGRLQAYVTQEVVAGEGDQLLTRSVVRNLSRERAVAEALERSERRFRRFFEEAPIGIALLDSEARITECNAAFRSLVDAPDDGLRGRPLGGLLTAGGREQVEAALARAARGATPPPLEARLGADGETVCTVFAARLEEAAGAAPGLIVHFIDTTEQKNLELQFTQSQKMQAVGQLAGGIAHDFNNLLTAMIGFCDLLLLRHRPGDQSFADLMQIKQNANRAANLVRQLLAFSRQQTLRPTVLSITDVLAELMHLLRRLIGENIELDIQHGRDLGPVKVDQGQLEQVIINLAVNARDAMAESGGKLTIRTSNVALERPLKREGEVVPPGDYVLIEVADNGRGIARENLDRVFEPFFSTKSLGAGTGLGLSTVYGIVKQTGGFILLDSAPGRGTTFSIYLPQHREAAGEAAAEAETQASRDLTGIGTLLLVEDEEAVRSFSARALRNKGYHVLEAASGEAALEVMEASGEPVDLLITDVVMPQLDGPGLVQRVRAARPDLKVIYISGYTEDSFRRRLDAEAGVRFLAKPYSLKQLAGVVKEVLREASA